MSEDLERWGPTRRPNGKARDLTPQQQKLADELHMRAAAIHRAADGELSIREAVDLAAVQLGLEAPQTVTEPGDES